MASEPPAGRDTSAAQSVGQAAAGCAAENAADDAAQGATESVSPNAAQGAADIAAQGAAAQSATQSAADNVALGAARGAAESADAGRSSAESPAQASARGSVGSATHGEAQGPAESTGQGPGESAAQGPAEGAAQGSSQNAAESGSASGSAAQVPAQSAGGSGVESAAQGAVQDMAESAAESGGESESRSGDESSSESAAESTAESASQGAAKAAPARSRISSLRESWYKRLSLVDIRAYSEAAIRRAGRGASLAPTILSSMAASRIPARLQLDEILANKTCSPMSLYDFHLYLDQVEFASENLEFLLWFRSYKRRWDRLNSRGDLPKVTGIELATLPPASPPRPAGGVILPTIPEDARVRLSGSGSVDRRGRAGGESGGPSSSQPGGPSGPRNDVTATGTPSLVVTPPQAAASPVGGSEGPATPPVDRSDAPARSEPSSPVDGSDSPDRPGPQSPIDRPDTPGRSEPLSPIDRSDNPTGSEPSSSSSGIGMSHSRTGPGPRGSARPVGGSRRPGGAELSSLVARLGESYTPGKPEGIPFGPSDFPPPPGSAEASAEASAAPGHSYFPKKPAITVTSPILTRAILPSLPLYFPAGSANRSVRIKAPAGGLRAERRAVADQYFTNEGAKQLNIPAAAREEALECLLGEVGDPRHLQPAADHVYGLLRNCSHRNFVRVGAANGTRETVCVATGLGVVLVVVGALVAMPTLALGRPVRPMSYVHAVAGYPFWWIGYSLVLSGMRGSSLFLLIISRRQPLPWERADRRPAAGLWGRLRSRVAIFDRRLPIGDDNMPALYYSILGRSVIWGCVFAVLTVLAFVIAMSVRSRKG